MKIKWKNATKTLSIMPRTQWVFNYYMLLLTQKSFGGVLADSKDTMDYTRNAPSGAKCILQQAWRDAKTPSVTHWKPKFHNVFIFQFPRKYSVTPRTQLSNSLAVQMVKLHKCYKYPPFCVHVQHSTAASLSNGKKTPGSEEGFQYLCIAMDTA